MRLRIEGPRLPYDCSGGDGAPATGNDPREASPCPFAAKLSECSTHLSVGGVGRYHLYIKIRKTHEGQPKNIICGAFGAHYDIKQVIVVDDDVEVHDPQQVEWAVATRFQADRDLVVISGAQGSVLSIHQPRWVWICMMTVDPGAWSPDEAPRWAWMPRVRLFIMATYLQKSKFPEKTRSVFEDVIDTSAAIRFSDPR